MVVGLQRRDKFLLFFVFLEQLQVFLVHCVKLLFLVYLPAFQLMQLLLLKVQLHLEVVDLIRPGSGLSSVLLLQAHVLEF